MGNDNLSKIFSGASVFFVGVIFELGISFFAKVTIARVTNPDLYGIVILGHTVFLFLTIFATFGLDSGVGRFLPREDDREYKRNIIISAILVVFPLSLIVGSVTYLFSAQLSTLLFGTPAHDTVFQLFAVGMPFFVFIRVAIGGIQGSKRTIDTVLLKNVSLPSTRFIGIGLVAVLSGGVSLYVGAYLASYVISALLGVVLLARHVSFHETRLKDFDHHMPTLVTFSAPLVLTTAIQRVISRADLILLGYFLQSSSVVGAYDVSLSLSQFLLVIVTSFGYIAMPIISNLHADGKMAEMKNIYSMVVKWINISTMPLVASFLVFPGAIISLTFGQSYFAGIRPLQILSVAFFLHIILGPSGNALKSIGKTRQLMVATFTGGLLNILLNISLIPSYSTIGAASATLVSYFVMNSIVLFYLRSSGFSLLSYTTVQVLIATVSTFAIAYFLSILLGLTSLHVHFLSTGFLLVLLYAPLTIRYFIGDQERELLHQVENKYPFSVSWLDRFFSRVSKKY